ncbi:MAG: hypothetical protein KDD67_07955 [Ignavibacteriae bacterium]|nr:hypothetical protein [Ignavibacteriota bacterium]MCB9215929.1 hypothetical protein [Ignavibacteria bacterium]
MEHRVKAYDLVVELGEQLGLSEEQVLSFFTDSPLDFPIYFASRLPFFVDRFGMVGITIRGKVWLLNKARNGHPIFLLSLVRHEAEHVAQQRREPILFYPRYFISWLGNFLIPFPSKKLRQFRKRFGHRHAAYRAISYEVEAYRVGDSLAERLRKV